MSLHRARGRSFPWRSRRTRSRRLARACTASCEAPDLVFVASAPRSAPGGVRCLPQRPLMRHIARTLHSTVQLSLAVAAAIEPIHARILCSRARRPSAMGGHRMSRSGEILRGFPGFFCGRLARRLPWEAFVQPALVVARSWTSASWRSSVRGKVGDRAYPIRWLGSQPRDRAI